MIITPVPVITSWSRSVVTSWSRSVITPSISVISDHNIFCDHTIITAWSRVKSFYPWSRRDHGLWSRPWSRRDHAFIFTGEQLQQIVQQVYDTVWTLWRSQGSSRFLDGHKIQDLFQTFFKTYNNLFFVNLRLSNRWSMETFLKCRNKDSHGALQT